MHANAFVEVYTVPYTTHTTVLWAIQFPFAMAMLLEVLEFQHRPFHDARLPNPHLKNKSHSQIYDIQQRLHSICNTLNEIRQPLDVLHMFLSSVGIHILN